MANGVANVAWACLCLVACQAPTILTVDCSSGIGCLTPDAGYLAETPASADPAGTLLTWDESGRISDNPFDIRGGWARAWDCDQVQDAIQTGTVVCSEPAPTPGCCTAWDASITGPDLEPGWSVTADREPPSSNTVCIKGTMSKVLVGTDGTELYGVMWGANFGIVLNDYGAYAANRPLPGGPIRGFSFDLTGSAPAVIRVGVNMPNVGNDFFRQWAMPTSGATVIFSEVEQGPWVQPPDTLDLARLQALNFTLGTVPENPTPFDICVSNVRVLQ